MRRELVPAVLCVLAFGVGAAASPYFLDARYLMDASSLYVETGLLALGMTLVILTGNIDLSVASMLALVACVTAKLLELGCPPVLAIVAAVVLGGALGTFNGIIVAKLKVPSFVVTLATMAAYRGVAQVMLGAQSVKFSAGLTGLDYQRLPGTPIPVPVCLLLVLAIFVSLLMSRTVFGRWVIAVGTSERASFFSGVPTDRVKMVVFALSGAFAGVAAVTMNSRLGVARFDHARGLEVDVITAVVLGGTSIYGGKGSILGSMVALLLIALIRTGLGVANVTAEYQLAAVGTLLIVAVLIGNLADRIRLPRRAI